MEKIYEEELIKDKKIEADTKPSGMAIPSLINNNKINDKYNNQNYFENINIKGISEVNKTKNNKDDNLEKENKEKKELEMAKFIDDNIESIIEELKDRSLKK